MCLVYISRRVKNRRRVCDLFTFQKSK